MTEHPAFLFAREYERAWRLSDGEAIAALYSPDCRYRSHPFRELEDARAYARRMMAEESRVEAHFGVPIVDGDRAAVEWWATLEENGSEITLAGFAWLRFDEQGLVVDSRDYWAQTDGRRPPPEGWGK